MAFHLEGHVLNELLFVGNDTIKKLICVAIKFQATPN